MSVFADRTYEALMEEALSRVSDTYDKREGSMIFNGNAPCLAEVAQVYIAIDFFLETTYIHSAPREFLVKRAADHHIYPEEAIPARFKAEFNIDVPIGTRFSVEDLNFVVIEKTDDSPETPGNVVYKVECETAGAVANTYKGAMVSIEYVKGLETAELKECYSAGVDEEETEAFRKRVLEALRSIAFGGNRADYRKWLLDSGKNVKAVKVYPVWNEDIKPSLLIPSEAVTQWYEGIVTDTSIDYDVKTWLTSVYMAALLKKLTVGGTVKIVFLAHSPEDVNLFVTPDEALVEEIQEYVDPKENAGEGVGIAPIGHVVTVKGAQEQEITIKTNITCKKCNFEDIKADVERLVNEYFDELKAQWEETENLVVRISFIESKIISGLPEYVTDIAGTLLNGQSENLTLDSDYIPALVEVINQGG